MNAHLRASLAELKAVFGPLFYRTAIPGGLLTIWPTADGWQSIAIPDRSHPKGELRQVPKDGSNHLFTLRFHYADPTEEEQAGCWTRIVEDATHG